MMESLTYKHHLDTWADGTDNNELYISEMNILEILDYAQGKYKERSNKRYELTIEGAYIVKREIS